MLRRRIPVALVALLCLACLASLGAATAPAAAAQPTHPSQPAQARGASAAVGFPTVDPSYIYSQLAYMVTRYQRREAGYDANLPVSVNGHDEFAAYWQAEMLRDLQGFGAQAQRDPFPVAGWQGRPTKVNAFNVEVTVPGVSQAQQMVVIGCHYDGEASSTQSANDDGSGCAIELGVAQALATYWRANHLYPARTLRFVAYDAEEQGIFGSFHFVNQTINGDLGNVVAMLNEEQNGIGYPLRYLGETSNPTLPTTTLTTPLTNNQSYQNTQSFTAAQQAAITSFNQVMQGAAPAAFAAFRALGYTSLTYYDDQRRPVTQQVFTPQDLQYAPTQDDNIGGSDNYPFGLDGLPSATFIGNYSYYDQNPPPWSYPYDQPQDTIQLMNIFASGQTAESKALELALALPGMLTTWALAQPAVLGFTASDGKPIAAISDIGVTQPGKPVSLNANAAYDPAQPGAALRYHWTFGDGAQADGATAQHTWASAGDYPLTLTVSDASGTRTISKVIHVAQYQPAVINPYTNYPQDGVPPSNPAVTLPQPITTSGGAGANGAHSVSATAPPSAPPWWLWLALAVVAVLAFALIGFGVGMARRPATLSTAGGVASPEAEAERQRREQALRGLLTPQAPQTPRAPQSADDSGQPHDPQP